MDERRARDQRIGDVAGLQRVVRAAVGEETALAGRIDERDEPPGLKLGVAGKMRRDPARREPRRLALDVRRADAGDEIDADAE